MPSIRLKSVLSWLLVICAQACTRDVPTPARPTPSSSTVSDSKKAGTAFSRKGTGIKRQKRSATVQAGNAKSGDAVPTAALITQCYEIWDVYYDLSNGTVIGEQYIDTRCYSVDGGSGVSSGGGGSSDGTSGSNNAGSWGTTATNDTKDNSPPADCDSWPFRGVGPSGYMACGVADIRIDVFSQYMGSDGNFHAEYVYFVFDQSPLFFEMPPSYTPGQAATLCAALKDRAERFVENKFGSSSVPPIGSVIESAFYNYLAGLMRTAGGRLSRTPNYPNTPIGVYSETLFPGGC